MASLTDLKSFQVPIVFSSGGDLINQPEWTRSMFDGTAHEERFRRSTPTQAWRSADGANKPTKYRQSACNAVPSTVPRPSIESSDVYRRGCQHIV